MDLNALPQAPPQPPARPRVFASAIQFSGKGSEYFRIWVVNILLMLVTLGLYYPWAKVRRLRYYYNHTDIDGYSLDFHGRPWRMLRSMILVGVFLALYANAGKISPVAGVVAVVALIALWPALIRASAQFRLANTSWRGKRFRFLGSMTSAYATMVVPLMMILLPFAWMGFTVQANAAPLAANDLGHVGLLFLLLPLSGPYFYWLFERYLHNNYAYGNQQSELRASVGNFYGLTLRTLGVVLLAMLALITVALVFVLVAVGTSNAAKLFSGGPSDLKNSGAAFMLFGAAVTAVYLSMVIVVRCYWITRSQNLIWSKTGNSQLRFRSELKLWPFMRLTIKNWLLIVVTLGFYWPFAAIATYRARIQAVRVASRQPLEQLSGGPQGGGNDACGDMAADMAGLDFGL
ncbi:MAG: YjgN family protein [Betaproteobacteria bacterium]